MDEHGVRELNTLSDKKARTMTGSVVASLAHLKDIDGTDGAFFVFPDLSVRCEGAYRLKFSLFEIVGNQVFFCQSITSAVFTVYSAKKFPGMEESTPLTKIFAEQGLKIRVRKEQKSARAKQSRSRQPPINPALPSSESSQPSIPQHHHHNQQQHQQHWASADHHPTHSAHHHHHYQQQQQAPPLRHHPHHPHSGSVENGSPPYPLPHAGSTGSSHSSAPPPGVTIQGPTPSMSTSAANLPPMPHAQYPPPPPGSYHRSYLPPGADNGYMPPSQQPLPVRSMSPATHAHYQYQQQQQQHSMPTGSGYTPHPPQAGMATPMPPISRPGSAISRQQPSHYGSSHALPPIASDYPDYPPSSHRHSQPMSHTGYPAYRQQGPPPPPQQMHAADRYGQSQQQQQPQPAAAPRYPPYHRQSPTVHSGHGFASADQRYSPYSRPQPDSGMWAAGSGSGGSGGGSGDSSRRGMSPTPRLQHPTLVESPVNDALPPLSHAEQQPSMYRQQYQLTPVQRPQHQSSVSPSIPDHPHSDGSKRMVSMSPHRHHPYQSSAQRPRTPQYPVTSRSSVPSPSLMGRKSVTGSGNSSSSATQYNVTEGVMPLSTAPVGMTTEATTPTTAIDEPQQGLSTHSRRIAVHSLLISESSSISEGSNRSPP
ncbi:hypothetical protein EC988_005318 [Linderina pennispora]|nr:hypothetical protein EC988_005318 [Linderina pennispora]